VLDEADLLPVRPGRDLGRSASHVDDHDEVALRLRLEDGRVGDELVRALEVGLEGRGVAEAPAREAFEEVGRREVALVLLALVARVEEDRVLEAGARVVVDASQQLDDSEVVPVHRLLVGLAAPDLRGLLPDDRADLVGRRAAERLHDLVGLDEVAVGAVVVPGLELEDAPLVEVERAPLRVGREQLAEVARRLLRPAAEVRLADGVRVVGGARESDQRQDRERELPTCHDRRVRRRDQR
jgi:hypothetical protein